MARKGECKIVIENYLQRKCLLFKIFTKYVKEYARLILYEDGSSVLEFKTDVNGRVKFRYEMESCIGVYLRVQMDHARAYWPVNSNPECCFTLINRDADKNVYLVAEESKIAHHWAWKLCQYIKVPQTVRKLNEEFSINDLIDVFNVLNAEPSLISEPSSWKFLGRNLGLADDTLQKIEDFHDTTEDRLYFCLLKWIKRIDKVDEKGGPTYYILVESLKKMKKEEIAERVSAKFNHESSVKSSPGKISERVTSDEAPKGVSPDEILKKHSQISQQLGDEKNPIKSTQPLLAEEETSNDHDDEEQVKTKSSVRGRVSTIAVHGHDEAYQQALAHRQRDNKLVLLLGAINHKMRNSKINVLAEIAALSNTNTSSHITINNETPHAMVYHQCFVVRGRISGYHGLNENIPPNNKKCFSFEKYSSLSLDGCAAMISLSATTWENTTCYFSIAFRNYVKFKNLTRNKAALLILNGANSMDKISNSQCFGRIMRNKDENPQFDGCYKGDIYSPSFISASMDRSGSHDFRNICFRIAMIDDPSRSQVNVTVEHPELLG